ncbi:5-oxoprolinase subunit PxpA [Herbiconiux sp. KACC 21604]|uniref:LamB/YcsF family protein n=1 Tax=unclassified Herbiconiux TaxID=2618217 RepID=UPI001491D777|nr:5-oxoprolinase subunit PxpA [Herbiconiux sp. SALV-R1]QJU53569.1 LamB/YcsF family protein [Herbiconiux sp. SALV-R1]WPO88550.1 5-oxoprolinase subunit PxpA [Herbiconiux sp. KACC 21604]
MPTIDLNADLGESYGAWTLGDDEAMLDVVSSANVACGFHAGDPTGLLATLRLAAARRVVVGAQVSYPDLRGFGRRDLDLPADDLFADVVYQIGALQGLAASAGTRVSYVKPHGALYNRIVHDELQAGAVVDALVSLDPSLALVGLPDSEVSRQAEAEGLRFVPEAFADRAYRSDGTLVSRREPGAVLHDPAEIAERMRRLALEGVVTSIDGHDIALSAETICVHGDTPGAVAIARTVRAGLEESGLTIGSFVA